MKITVNGELHHVDGEHEFSTTLIHFLRNILGKTGTKQLCSEGACGACSVVASFFDSTTNKYQTRLVNSCLQPLYSCDGWHVITIEGLGSKKKGYHSLQKIIGDKHGAQCGFCTPGFVMSVYSMVAGKTESEAVSYDDILKVLDGNLCRCTGYRAISDFAKAAADGCKNGELDIEDLGQSHCSASGFKPTEVEFTTGDGKTWCQPLSLASLYETLARHKANKVQFVAGSTASEIGKGRAGADVFILLRNVAELCTVRVDSETGSLCFGAAVTLTQMLESCSDVAAKNASFVYLRPVVDHITQIGTNSVRNMSSWAGNLAFMKRFRGFQSDVYVLLEAAGAEIVVGNAAGKQSMSASEYLDFDMTDKLILELQFFPKASTFVLWSYKVSPRASSALAVVSCAFSMNVVNGGVLGAPCICYTGLGRKMTHALSAEKLLEDKKLTTQALHETLMNILADVDANCAEIHEFEAKKMLTLNLFFKFWTHLFRNTLPEELKSAASNIKRKLMDGEQKFQIDDGPSPVGKPVKKIEMDQLTSGEAKFTADKPAVNNQLYACLVVTDRAVADIISIDPTPALDIDGVHEYISSDDIPGIPYTTEKFRLFRTEKSNYAGQIVGLILADTQLLANIGARAVVIKYGDLETPVLDARTAYKKEMFFSRAPFGPCKRGDIEKGFKESDVIIEGDIYQNGQSHHFIEPMVANAEPTEDGVAVTCASQSISYVQQSVANLTGLPFNSVGVTCPRIGGSFGGKAELNDFPAVACGLAAHLTGRPVRINMTLQQYLQVAGKRTPGYAIYKVGVLKSGVVKAFKLDFAFDLGADTTSWFTFEFPVVYMQSVDGGYFFENFETSVYSLQTNTPPNHYARAPASLPPAFILENIMERIAIEMKLDISTVREANLLRSQQTMVYNNLPIVDSHLMKVVWDRAKSTTNWAARADAVVAFNKVNRFKKRGMAIVPSRYPIGYFGMSFNGLVSIYKEDGSVVLFHGGIEMGQAINTKVAQLAANILNCPLELIKVAPPNTLVSPDAPATGGSVTTELAGRAVMNCCEELVSGLAPIRDANPGLEWKALIKKAGALGIDLQARSIHQGMPPDKPAYNLYSVMACETEIDVLTGDNRIIRCDIVHDCGKSLNPAIDVGQIEGAFLMGMGNFTTEKIAYDPKTGRLLTDSTWTYHIPTIVDAPQDFRIELLPDATNPHGILTSKAIGEPPILGSVSAFFALKEAVNSARKDAGLSPVTDVDGPLTNEDIVRLCGTNVEHLTSVLPQEQQQVELVHVYA